MHFNYIFDYHSHICEQKNKDLQPVTVTWLLLTVSLLVPPAGLIYLHNCRLTGNGTGFGGKKYIYKAIWSLRFNRLISRKYKHFSNRIESCTESHCLHAAGIFSFVTTAKPPESPKLLTKHSILGKSEFELYYTRTYALLISELF